MTMAKLAVFRPEIITEKHAYLTNTRQVAIPRQ